MLGNYADSSLYNRKGLCFGQETQRSPNILNIPLYELAMDSLRKKSNVTGGWLNFFNPFFLLLYNVTNSTATHITTQTLFFFGCKVTNTTKSNKNVLTRFYFIQGRNRLSNKFIPVTKDKSSNSADTSSHQILLKAGFVRQVKTKFH